MAKQAKAKAPDNDTIFSDLIKATGNPLASVAAEGGADISGYIDSGSASLNALLSASIRGGYPANKITGLAGDPSTGKTFLMLFALKNFLDANPKGFGFIYDSEFNISEQLLHGRGIDTNRVSIVPVATVEKFRTQCAKVLDAYLELPKSKRPPLFMALDSLGMLSTEKEMADISSGKDVADMTRARLIKGTFRALTLKLGEANVPMIVTNHTYMTIGMFASKKMGGGTGLEYAASTIIFLSKKKDAEGTGLDKNIIGVELTALLKKSRNTIEYKSVDTYLSYEKGLDPYYGLLDIAVAQKVVKKLPKGEYEFPLGVLGKESEILEAPDQFFTEDVLEAIEEKCPDIFKYSRLEKVEDENKVLTDNEE